MLVNGFHLVRKSDSAELVRWVDIPARIEVFDAETTIRVDAARVGWDNGSYAVLATNWSVADPLPQTAASWFTFVGRFADSEWAGVQKAINNQVTAGNGALARWIALSTVNGVDMSSAQTATYKAQLVSAAILTQARADAIFVAP